MQSKNFFQKAFTVIEILVVITVLGLIVAGTTFAYNGYQQRARETKNAANAKTFVSTLEQIAIQNAGKVPTAANMTNSTWRATNNFKQELYKDAENKEFIGIGSSNLSSYVSVLIPDYNGDSREPCAAMIQVKSVRTSVITNSYIDLCPEGVSNFGSFPTTGCPSQFVYYADSASVVGSASIGENGTTGFCEITGSSIY